LKDEKLQVNFKNRGSLYGCIVMLRMHFEGEGEGEENSLEGERGIFGGLCGHHRTGLVDSVKKKTH
jgi:hypothetical protein